MRIILIFTLLLFPLIVKSQTGYNLPPKSYYSVVNVTLKDFKKYECEQVYIKPDSIMFFNTNSRLNESLALSNIDYMRVQEGNQGLKWCGYGALLMGVIAVMNVTEYPSQDSGGIVIGFTISGAVVGGLIGLAIPKWKTYYLNY